VAWEHHSPGTISIFVKHCASQRGTLAKVMESFPLAVTFRRDLVGPRLASWNALLLRLDFVIYRKGHMSSLGI
jgi:hypothetical protein